MGIDTSVRFVLLNYLVSRSMTRFRGDIRPPTHGARELIGALRKRADNGWTVEYISGTDDVDEEKRKSANEGLSFIRLKQVTLKEEDKFAFACLLFQYVDASKKNFGVVDIKTFEGRPIAGTESERGGTYAHMMIRIPLVGAFDTGIYRCAIEAAPSVSRSLMQHLMTKQLRRDSAYGELSFSVPQQRRRGPPSVKNYGYTVRIDLMADVGRTIASMASNRDLAKMLFTKRATKQHTATELEVEHEDFLADLQVTVGAKQGPADAIERLSWASRVRETYERLGYETRLFFRSIDGDVAMGQVHPAIASATDLLICPRERVEIASEAREWTDSLNQGVLDALRTVLDKDELWQVVK